MSFNHNKKQDASLQSLFNHKHLFVFPKDNKVLMNLING